MAISPTAETILNALEKIFLSPRIAVTVFLVCLTALLVGPHFPALAPSIQQHKAWLWLFLLVSAFYSATFLTEWLWRVSSSGIDRKRRKQRLVEQLEALTIPEKHILQEHIENGTRFVSWSVNRLEIASLAHDGIIGLIQQQGTIGYFKVLDEPWAYLQQHKELLATPGNLRPKRTGNEWMF